MQEPIAEFYASLPNIKSAILVGMDESQVKLDVPASDKREILKLAQDGFEKALRVVVYEA